MKTWMKVAAAGEFPENAGVCVKHGNEQIAVFNFNRTEWYAVQNLCPHNRQMVLARGLIGDCEGEPKVACPLHKNAFSLKTGGHLGGKPEFQLKTYPIKQVGDFVFVEVDSVPVEGEIHASEYA